MTEERVVTCFLEHRGRILVLRRSEKVGTYRGKWGGVAGYIKANETPDQAARREIEEEVGLTEVKLIKRGTPHRFVDPEIGIVWIVHPYRFRVDAPRIRTDWEHVEHKWIHPQEIENYETVPKLKESWKAVRETKSP